MNRLLSAVGAFIGRWYVSAVIATVLGTSVGALIFLQVYPGRPQIGVIDIPFTVIDEDSAFVIGEMLDYARRDDSIRGVVLKLVTPGGAVASSEELYLKMLRLREKKPVVVSSGWINASGGMQMSMGANYIYAQPGSFVGSIGVVFGLPQPDPPSETLITTGPAKGTGGSQETFVRMMELIKESFIQTVVSERGDRLRMTPAELAEARIYLGLEAVPLGLVDAIGSDADAIDKAASLAGISNYGMVDVNEKVIRNFVLKEQRIFGSSADAEVQQGFPDVARLRRIAPHSQGDVDLPGLPPSFTSGPDLPRMYYLYVSPTE